LDEKQDEDMKATVKIEQEVEIKTVLVEIKPRYIGDTDDDDMPSTFPLLDADTWRARIDIDSGKIENWPEGEKREMFVKVCDAGSYHLFDAENKAIKSIENNYVPNDLIPGEYGDYIDLKINGNGVITNWPQAPSISEFFGSNED
jgi:hypothetical protein